MDISLIFNVVDLHECYEFELPEDMDIYPIFNVSNLYECHELDDEAFVPDDYPKKHNEEVEQILGQRVGKKTRGKDYIEYLVKWKNKPIEDSTWISQSELDSAWVVIVA